ncbi:MAG: ATP-binding protein [Gemmatimonadaceae bacterium]|nr:ATP-binding protein [Gemmatimonadaceae bacterium]
MASPVTDLPVEPAPSPSPGYGAPVVPETGAHPRSPTPVRYTPPHAHRAIAARAALDAGRVLRWVFVVRVAMATAILLAAVLVWNDAEPVDTLVATLAFALGTMTTVVSVMWVELWRRPAKRPFYLMQFAVDLLLVTAAVHVTGGAGSQFAAVYVLVIAVASLVLAVPDALAVAGLAGGLYVLDAFVLRGGPGANSLLTPGGGTGGVWVQLVVLGVVAVGATFIGQRLRQSSPGGDALAAALVKVQLEAADILRTIRSGIVTVDRDGRLLYSNPAADDLLGLKLRQRIGKPMLRELATISPELASALERSGRDGVRLTRQQGTVHRDGHDVPIGVTTTIADAHGGPAEVGNVETVTAIFQDISDTKRAQALAMRNERLQAVAELSASLAHEIKNPLASIRSAAEQLDARHARRPDASADDDEHVLFGLMLRESDRLSRLLTEFLDFARVRKTTVAPIDLTAVADGVVALIRAHPDRAADVRVEASVAEGLEAIDGDEDLLHRALFNLMLNGVQAVGAAGTVRLEIAAARDEERFALAPLGLAEDAAVVALRVTDDGPGIAVQVRDRLFDPFVTTRAGGSGLGLPLVHRAVEAHGGVVFVDSDGDGTRFTMLLPTVRTDRAASDPLPLAHAA